MQNIDVHDLPEEEAQMVAAFVEFLRGRRGQKEFQHAREAGPELGPAEVNFGAWDLGVKGPLTREEIYDHL